MNRKRTAAARKPSAIKAENISKTYRAGRKGEFQALKGVSFEVQEGEIVGLVGPNGAGKSTLLRILLGLIEPDAGGSVSIFDQAVDSLDARRRIGYQADSQFRSQTVRVRDFLQLRSDLSGVDDRQTIDAYLKFFNLADDAQRPLSALSKGMRQKVELIFSFIAAPQLVFLDEPTAALDPTSVFELRDFLKQQKKRHVSVFFSSHNLTEVEQVCDRVLFINHGAILDEQAPHALKRGSLERLFKKYFLGPGK